jgi:anti-sigma B factor antagonist
MAKLGHTADAVPRGGDDRLTVSLTYDHSLFVIEPFGELDLATADRLEDTIARALKSPAATVLVDLSGLHFIDSSGIRVLLHAARRARDEGRTLRFLRGADQVERTLALCGLERDLPFLD